MQDLFNGNQYASKNSKIGLYLIKIKNWARNNPAQFLFSNYPINKGLWEYSMQFQFSSLCVV